MSEKSSIKRIFRDSAHDHDYVDVLVDSKLFPKGSFVRLKLSGHLFPTNQFLEALKERNSNRKVDHPVVLPPLEENNSSSDAEMQPG